MSGLSANQVVIESRRVEDLVALDLDAEIAALPAWRRERCLKFRFAADQRRSIAVWKLFAQSTAKLGVDVNREPIIENEFGCLAFENRDLFHFSFSHAEERVMVALSCAPIGCDLEKVRPLSDGLLDAALSAEDAQFVRAQTTTRLQEDTFCRLWVRKEAYAKALGTGLSAAIQNLSFRHSIPGTVFYDLIYPDGYFASGSIL